MKIVMNLKIVFFLDGILILADNFLSAFIDKKLKDFLRFLWTFADFSKFSLLFLVVDDFWHNFLEIGGWAGEFNVVAVWICGRIKLNNKLKLKQLIFYHRWFHELSAKDPGNLKLLFRKFHLRDFCWLWKFVWLAFLSETKLRRHWWNILRSQRRKICWVHIHWLEKKKYFVLIFSFKFSIWILLKI